MFAVSAAMLILSVLSLGYILAQPELIGEYAGRLVVGFHST
jgi:hypothetical protein